MQKSLLLLPVSLLELYIAFSGTHVGLFKSSSGRVQSYLFKKYGRTRRIEY